MVSFDEMLEKGKTLTGQEEKTETVEAATTEEKKEVEVEEIETEVDEKTEEEKTETKEFLSLLETVKPEEEKKPEIPADVLAEIESYKTKLSAYESDPLHKAVALGASRDELLAIAAELKGKDFSKTSYKDLLASEIKDLTGFEGEALTEQVEEALAEHNSLPAWKQAAEERKLREKFQSTSKVGDSPTLQNLENAYLEKSKLIKTPEQFKAEIQQVAESEKGAIRQVGSKLVGSTLYGVEFTKDMLEDIISKDYDVEKIDKAFLDEKGDLKVGEFIQKKFIDKSLPLMIEWAKEEGRREANKGTAKTKDGGKKGSAPIVKDRANTNQEKVRGLLPDYIVNKLK